MAVSVALVKPEAGIYRSAILPDFWLRLEWLWQMPDAVLTFSEMAGFSSQLIEEIKKLKGN